MFKNDFTPCRQTGPEGGNRRRRLRHLLLRHREPTPLPSVWYELTPMARSLLRSLRPLDSETVAESVAKTNRAVCIEEGWPTYGVTAELATRIQSACFEDLDAQTLDAHYAVNVRAMALLSVEFARRYPGGPGGRIINFSSGQSLGPMPGELAYIATKGAIEAFTRTLAAEVWHKGMTVNAINPGPTDTGWMDDELRRESVSKFPLGRIGQPEDAARLVAFLASDEAAWITGQTIHSEGGFLRA